ncbi:type II secretion system protein N [Jeongeupia chitinilytica]|uniref:Type II secretion system protein GspC N-terminal domain-containing protein n=1 Tax=Jeongeupia chitinilytica TaxID=1041641 RepID=A0ABQ3GWD7_9NEIS|nr:type II secretion system protein N [Jeongeupia chitinilytica]GHD58332.1 hypothetical protein GCM10007350_08050 [Jeongeupia chitinilytica]
MLRVPALKLKWPATGRAIPVLEFMLTLALAWLAAGLFWLVLAPRSAVPVLKPPETAPAVPNLVWRNAPAWFGATAGSETASTLSARLIAVIAGDERSSAAVFSGIEASAVAVRVGQAVQPGVQLVRVARDRVELERNGRREILMLDGHDASAMATTTVAPVAAAATPATGELPAQTLYRGQLAATMQAGNIADWAKGLAAAPGGGILINDPAQQPLARSLQLQAGDVLKSVNGQVLAQPADMSLLLTVFSQQAQIKLSVLRGGAPTTLQYQIQP